MSDPLDQSQEQGGFGGVPVSIPGITQIAKASNQNVIVGNTGHVHTGAQNATAVNVAGAGGAVSVATASQGGTTHVGTTISATATSVTSVTDPSTGYTTETIVTPLFTITKVTPPGVSALPTVTVVIPPNITMTALATSDTSTFNPSTGYTTEVMVTPIFTVTVVTPPGIGALPTVTVYY